MPVSASPELVRLKELESKLDIYKSTLAEIYRQYDQKLEELSLVRRLGDALRSTRELEALARTLLENVAQEAAIDRLTLMLTGEEAEPDRGRLLIRAAYWADQEIFTYFDLARSEPWSLDLPGERDRTGVPAAPLTILSAAPEYDPLNRPGDQARSLVFLPLRVPDRLLGLLVLSRPESRPFTPDDERVLAIMGDQAGSALANVLLFDDLTRVNLRLVESEGRARRASGYLSRLLETANDAIFTLDRRGLITYANRKAAQWGWPKETLTGREFRKFLTEPDSLPGWRAGDPPPTDQIFEAVLTDAAGRKMDVLLSTSQVEGRYEADGPEEGGPDEAHTSWMVLATDLTEHRQLERQLIHSEKLASIGLLAAGVAHEVGNPLSAISGYAQILEAGAESEAERREYLGAILNQTGRIQKILRELLDYSRPSSGLAAELDLAETLPRTLNMIRAQKIFRQVEVVLDLDPDHGPHLVSLDPDHLTQITVIIALNAAQAMGGRGRFEVALGRRPGWVTVSFTDTGPGIPMDIAGRLFDPFFTTKNPGEGTGLGLSICQRLVDGCQGRIEVQSQPGRGATFIVRLPESPPAGRESRP
ncbi:MAG: GAF domain-containing protein [Candidatus Adiutrix sp.]|nr:GAF domain-containing protein [Candidatus Adiutrix sp.]